ncbi:hypothetical protein PUN28_014186 [Cardiocondyla obscurior]|uniref:Uncharacterized protein n=1 Tax=Cardiocondyla obscurior TaxID=286306 RepID=A0AAW2F332_9HYME
MTIPQIEFGTRLDRQHDAVAKRDAWRREIQRDRAVASHREADNDDNERRAFSPRYTRDARRAAIIGQTPYAKAHPGKGRFDRLNPPIVDIAFKIATLTRGKVSQKLGKPVSKLTI